MILSGKMMLEQFLSVFMLYGIAHTALRLSAAFHTSSRGHFSLVLLLQYLKFNCLVRALMRKMPLCQDQFFIKNCAAHKVMLPLMGNTLDFWYRLRKTDSVVCMLNWDILISSRKVADCNQIYPHFPRSVG